MRGWLTTSERAVDQALSAHPRLRLLAWASGGVTLMALFSIRAASGAEFAFASLALLPVIWSAWVTGRLGGWVMALLAASTWIAGDLASDREFPSLWVPWVNGAIHGCMYVLVASLAAKLQGLLRQEHERATRDGLTGLLNRRQFLEAGQLEVARASRHRHSLTVLFLDLDHFKELNDSQGHGAGDKALKTVAQALLSSSRVTDLVARLGGDEFAVLLADVKRDEAAATVRRLHKTVNESLKGFPGLTVSLGAAYFDQPMPDLAEMLQIADSLMYRAKQAGGGALVGDFLA